MGKPKIKVKSFEKSFERFVRLRAVPAVAEQVDYRNEHWPVWHQEFEVNEDKLYHGLMVVVDRMVLTYKQKQEKTKNWYSSRKIIQPWPDYVDIKQGMPIYLQLTFAFTKLDNGRPVLQFKMHMKRHHCRKRRIALMTIPI